MTPPAVIGVINRYMKDIRNILIVGGGMMGKNIAFVLTANPDLRITVTDIAEQNIHGGIRQSCKQLVEHGVISADALETRLEQISFTTDMSSAFVENADLVIEAVFEDMAVKRTAFAQLEAVCAPDCIFCTNTSVMSPSEISAELKFRDRFVGTHFWNPAHLIPLVEVVKSDATSNETADTVLALLRSVGKKPILCKKDVPGFVANRMQHALWREAISIVENGIADAETVDMAVKYSFGLRLPQLGPLENADMVGTDLTYSIHDYLLSHLESSAKPSPLLTELYKKGELGFKTGGGFRSWTPEQMQAVKDDLNTYLIKALYDK
jgi:3-hydroxybutyryl-CoA dehydrogenase